MEHRSFFERHFRRWGYRLFTPQAALILAALFWAGNFIVGRSLKETVDPVTLNFWRWVTALAVLLPMGLGELKVHGPLLASRWKSIAGLGFTGVAAFHICAYEALKTTTAVNALIILSSFPVLILIMTWALFREGVNARQGLGILVSMIGALILVCRGDWGVLAGFAFHRGDLWMVVAVFLMAVYTILLRSWSGPLPQTAVLTSSVIAGLVMMLPAYFWTLSRGSGLSLTLPHTAAILYIGVFASVLAFLFWNYGVARIGPARAGMFIHFMPLFGALLSVVFLGEGVALFHLTGALFVGTGILLTRKPV